MEVSEWFLVNFELRQSCVMSPWLFMDGVMQEVNASRPGEGLEQLRANSDRVEIKQELFTDDTALASS